MLHFENIWRQLGISVCQLAPRLRMDCCSAFPAWASSDLCLTVSAKYCSWVGASLPRKYRISSLFSEKSNKLPLHMDLTHYSHLLGCSVSCRRKNRKFCCLERYIHLQLCPWRMMFSITCVFDLLKICIECTCLLIVPLSKVWRSRFSHTSLTDCLVEVQQVCIFDLPSLVSPVTIGCDRMSPIVLACDWDWKNFFFHQKLSCSGF